MNTDSPLRWPFVMDGATGTELQKRGMPTGVCTEQWILEHPEVLLELQRAYVAAGADVLTAPTFGANPASLARFGLEDKIALRLGEGLLTLQPGETDAIVIAGMGGLLIAEILSAGRHLLAEKTR